MGGGERMRNDTKVVFGRKGENPNEKQKKTTTPRQKKKKVVTQGSEKGLVVATVSFEFFFER